MSLALSTARRNSVYFKAGTFTGDTAPRFIKAPFDQLVYKGKLYLMPLSFGGGQAFIGQAGNADADTVRQVRGDFGYETLSPVVVEEQEMGCKDEANSWKSMHRFGQI